MYTRLLTAAVLLFAVASLSAQDAVFKDDVKQYVQAGEKAQDIKATLTIGAESLTVARNAKDVTVIPFSSLTGATYDRRQRQRKMLGMPMTGAAMAGAAQKVQHFLTIRYKTATAGDFVELELGKDIAARVVSTLEVKSGQTVEKTGS